LKDKPPAQRPPTRARSTLGWWYTTTGKAREQKMLGTIIGIGLALLFPLINSALGLGWEAKAIPITLFIVLALGLNVVVGFAGLLDLGYVAFYALGAGQVDVIRGDEVVATLGPGDHFGEVALLTDAPRNATVVAHTPARVFRLDREGFTQVVARTLRRGVDRTPDRTMEH